MTVGLESLVDYIVREYGGASRIIEVGVGELTRVIEGLRGELVNCELSIIDVKRPSRVPPGVEFVPGDVTRPDLKTYEGSDLIYSIRPPPELQSPLISISRSVRADLILKPVSSEEAPRSGELINHEGLAFYKFEF